MVQRASCPLLTALALLLSISTPAGQGRAAHQQAQDDAVELTLLLIGDAGAAAPEGDAVLHALSKEIGRDATRTAVVFLGDNIYPNGLPVEGHEQRAESERRLLAQVGAAKWASRSLFVPGNHDWSSGDSVSDWEAVSRQGAFLAATGSAELWPTPGCPGPAVLDLGSQLRLVMLDTEWWLHGRPTPPSERGCGATDTEGVVTGVRDAIEGAGTRHVVIAAHHPPVSAGPHAGQFGLLDHLFPLRALKPWAWLPLPVLGSVYPVSRKLGVSPQDQSSRLNKEMMSALRTAIEPGKPLLFAAGHEHQLAVFDGTEIKTPIGARYVVVSGAGMEDHQRGKLGNVDGVMFAAKTPGFVRLRFLSDGRVHLEIVAPDSDGVVVLYSTWLE